jgi:hypothetical protein
MIGDKPELVFGCFGMLVVEKAKGKWGSIGGGGSPLHAMVDFSRR